MIKLQLLVLCLSATVTATAGERQVPPRAPACTACHGIEGISGVADIPNLAGQKKEYLASQLQAFKSGERRNPLMSAVARQLSAAEIDELAAYWNSLPAAGTPGRVAAAPHAATLTKMPWPAAFPAGFSEYTRVENAERKIITVRHVNTAALAAARAGQALPEGTIIIVSNHAAVLDGAGQPTLDAQGRWKLGEAVSFAGMETRPGWGEAVPETLRNGNWNYNLWTAQHVSALGAQQPRCLACHKPRADDSYVFTIDEMRQPPR